MKFGVFVNPKRPKVPVSRILNKLRQEGHAHSQEDPDIALVVGGDGTFGYYGRTLSVPLLFVGVRESGLLGSKARLAQAFFDDIEGTLQRIAAGRYRVKEIQMLACNLNGRSVDFLTDVYLERGNCAGCLRYKTTVLAGRNRGSSPFSDYAIGNGVIFCTPFGSGGYYSYPSRLERSHVGESMVENDETGVCHILPTYLTRLTKGAQSGSAELQYTIPRKSTIKVELLRDADVRLYGITAGPAGVKLGLKDVVTIKPSRRIARVILRS